MTAFKADNLKLVVFELLEFLVFNPFLLVPTGRSLTLRISAMSNFLFLSLLSGAFTSELFFAVDELFEDGVELVAALMFSPVFFSCTDYRRKDARYDVESGL